MIREHGVLELIRSIPAYKRAFGKVILYAIGSGIVLAGFASLFVSIRNAYRYRRDTDREVFRSAIARGKIGKI
jgi:hypothetical protein